MAWSGGVLSWFLLLAIVGAIIAVFAIKVAMEYERGVVFRLGRYHRTAGPGLFFIIPLIETVKKVGLRVEVNEIKQQEMITKDSISLLLSAVVFFKVKSPKDAIVEVMNYYDAIDQYSLTTLRNVIGATDLDGVLSDREKVSGLARRMLDEVAERWGVEAQRVEIKQIELPESMKRAMAREAEAIRERRARVTKAEGEAEAAAKLVEAAKQFGSQPGAIELRRLQTMAEVGAEHNSTIILGIPQEFLAAAKAVGASVVPFSSAAE